VDLDLIRERLGVTVKSVSQDELKNEYKRIKDSDVAEQIKTLMKLDRDRSWVNEAELSKALRLALAVRRLVDSQDADGCALSCFRLIEALNTTGCLALSQLNDSDDKIGACEGDLDAALTMMLARFLGVEHLWMGNPIIFPDNEIQLVHCTSARTDGERSLPCRLMAHHESGKGVSLDVSIPEDRQVTLVRIGNDLKDIMICGGRTKSVDHLQTCRTQARIEISSSSEFVAGMMGTHVICCAGDFRDEFKYCANMLGLVPYFC
jgi:L-fucose isomerase-like protein